MNGKIVTLIDGLKVGDKVHLEAELKLPDAQDIIDAGVQSERAVMTQQGWLLLTSPTLIAQHTLCRQIVRIGDHKGPLSMAELGKLSAVDLQLLQARADQLDRAIAEALEARGRAGGSGGGAGAR